MAKPALSIDAAALHMGRGDLNRVSRAKPRGGTKGGRPKMPADFKPEHSAVWRQMVKILAKRRTLTPGDGPALTLYCRTFVSWTKACDDVDKNGVMMDETRYSKAGDEYHVHVPNPAVKIAAELKKTLDDTLSEFGLTGKSRDKVPEVAKPEKSAPVPGTVDFIRQQQPAEEPAPFVLDSAPESEEENDDRS